jgi:oxepin-CoA hydrolase/3-oxo-5,6-dehydrosuberyl-CoA semialdehyde dehydrogenase
MKPDYFDGQYVEEVLERLRSLPADAKPRWGSMTPDLLVGHLTNAIRYSMGRSGTFELHAAWLVRRVIGPYILRPVYVNGWLPFPKNVKGFDALAQDDDLETLHAVLEDYLSLVQADELSPPPHPLFGDLGIEGWARLHIAHFEHHLRQFGV